MLRLIFAFALVAIGCAVSAGHALAQYYPPHVYRGAPPAYPDDDDLYDQPGDYRTLPPYPGPRTAPYEQRSATPDRYGRPVPQARADGDPNWPPRPPGAIYQDEPPPAYGYPPRQAYPVYPGSQQPYPGRAYPQQQAPRQGAAEPDYPTGSIGQNARPPSTVAPPQNGQFASLPPEDRPEEGSPKELPPQLRRQVVDYRGKEPAGTLVVDTANTYLYLVLGNGQAMRYGIGVGREGFTWAGEERISRMAEWPDWHPPADMIERQPYLPRFMAGGPGNPLGARALYLGKSLYRIHGTNQPSTIGQFVSSGCIRLLNEDIEDLYGRVNVGTRVVVLSGKPSSASVAR